MDIEFGDTIDGIALAAQINAANTVSIIYVTASKDEETFSKGQTTRIQKHTSSSRMSKLSLQTAIELAIFNTPVKHATGLQPASMGDTFFIKDNNRLVKIRLRDILAGGSRR